MFLANSAVHSQNEAKESAHEIQNQQEKVKPIKMTDSLVKVDLIW